MKSKLNVLILLIIILVFSFSNLFADKSYNISLVNVIAKIDSNANLHIQEDRTYNFRGKFSWADYKLPLKDLGNVSDIRVRETGSDYIRSNENRPDHFIYTTSNNELYIKWFYYAVNEKRTFTISYTISDAVKRYNDIAEFYYKFAGKNRPKQIDSLYVEIHLPQPANKNDVKIWAHGPLHGNIYFNYDFVNSWVSPLPVRYYWENRIIFPENWLSSNVQKIPRNALQTIMNEEKAFAKRANEQREKALQNKILQQKNDKKSREYSYIMVAFGLLALYFLYQKYGKGHQIRSVGSYSSEIPDNLPPAVINYVNSDGSPDAGALMSTIMDLAKRGFLKIEDSTQEGKSSIWSSNSDKFKIILNRSYYQDNKQNLRSFEGELIHFLFTEISDGYDAFTFKDFSGSRSSFQSWFSDWSKSIKLEWGDNRIYEKKSIRGLVYAIISAILIIGAGILMIIKLSDFGLIALFSGIALLFLSLIILTYTKEAKQIKERTKAFKNYLNKYHYQNEPASLMSNFENYLIYGLAAGVGVGKIKKMFAALGDSMDPNFIPWYTSIHSSRGVSSMANAFSTMVTTASTTMSSAAGVGGGASAGGGGGAGGAGGGAG